MPNLSLLISYLYSFHDLQFDTSFIPDDILDIPQLGNDSILTLDSTSDVFADIDLFEGDFAGEDPLIFDELLGDVKLDSEPRNRATPSTSESGNLAGGSPSTRATESGGSEPHTSSGGSGAGDASNSLEGEDDAKRQARMQRNRENAFLSRQRKKQQMQELQQTCSHLRGQTTQLTCLVHRLVAENCLLRHHLGTACKQAGMPLPDVPSAMKAQGAIRVVPPTAAAGAVPGVVPQSMMNNGLGVLPSTGFITPAAMLPGMRPGVPLQPANITVAPGMAVARATAAPAPAPAAPPAAPPVTASGRPIRNKRARMTGAGAAFLALFSVFLFVSPLTPGGGGISSKTMMPMTSNGPATRLLPVLSTEVVGSSAVLDPLVPISGGRSGRALLQSTATIEDSEPLPKPLPMPASLVNQTLEALLQDPRTQKVPAEALQRLQDLAPAAVLLDPNEQNKSNNVPKGGAASPLSAATAFPTLADQFFKAAGLDAPQACQKVFEFDAATIPHPARSRRSVEKFITGAYGFKGRSMGLPEGSSSQSKGAAASTSTLQLPAAKGGSSNLDSSLVVKGPQQPLLLGDGSNGNDDSSFVNESVDPSDALPIAVSEPTLVSVLLPANANKSAEFGGLSAIDRVFVVLLHPGDRFLTYSCGLSRPLLV